MWYIDRAKDNENRNGTVFVSTQFVRKKTRRSSIGTALVYKMCETKHTKTGTVAKGLRPQSALNTPDNQRYTVESRCWERYVKRSSHVYDRKTQRTVYIYIYKIIIWFQGFGQEFFLISAEVCDSRNWNSRSNSFVRAPPSGGGSKAPRPAVSVPHIDVNADGCRARQARSCKNTACREGISEILVES